jgi:hypothetical protein
MPAEGIEEPDVKQVIEFDELTPLVPLCPHPASTVVTSRGPPGIM